MGGVVEGIAQAWGASEQAGAERHAADMEHDSAYRAWSLETQKELNRQSEWKSSQEMAAKRWDAWQASRNAFLSKLGYSMPGGGGGGGGSSYIAPNIDPAAVQGMYKDVRAAEAGKWYQPPEGSSEAATGGSAAPGATNQQGTTLGQLGGVSPTVVAPTAQGREWNDWRNTVNG